MLLLFESGDTEYDSAFLDSRSTICVSYPGIVDIKEWVSEQIRYYAPDRVYIEGNAMSEGLVSELPDSLRIDFAVTIINGATLALYYINMRKLLGDLIRNSHQVFFNRCEKSQLQPYANFFKVINRKASYLWEAPSGYHEKAFGILVPYDTETEHIDITEDYYTPFFLDSHAEPDKYSNKSVSLTCLVKHSIFDGSIIVGRHVMTCCAADIQFLAFPCEFDGCQEVPENTWIAITASCRLTGSVPGQKCIKLHITGCELAAAPANLTIGM